MLYARALIGVAVLLILAWAMSTNRRRVPWRLIVWGLGLQVLLGLLILGTAGGRAVFEVAGELVTTLVGMTQDGAALVFGPLADPQHPEYPGFIFAFAGTGLLVIVFFAALMSVLYHLGVMQVLIWLMAKAMTLTMKVSGAEAMAMAANVFVGQTEAPLVVKPYIPLMTRSELGAMMTGGFATIAGSVLAVYVSDFVLGPGYAPHLLTASVMSAPAAFVIAKIVWPETETPVTGSRVEFRLERTSHNLIEAAANGTQDGLKLYLNVIAMLVAFTALVALINWPLGWLGEAALQMPRQEVDGVPADPLTLARCFGWLLAPLAWCIGIDSWHDCQLFGALLGTKIAINEFIAFKDMANMIVPPENVTGAAVPGVFQDARSAQMAAYALCGFANFASIGIQIGGITPLAPQRKTDLSRLALRAMLGGALASSCTATIAGVFI